MPNRLEVNPDLLDLIGDVSNVGLWTWSLAEDTIHFSDSFLMLLGIAPGDLGLSLDDVNRRIHPADSGSTQAAFSAHIAIGTPLNLKYRLRHDNGDYLFVQARAKCLLDDKGAVVSSVGSIEDITQSQAQELELRDSKAFMRLLMDINPDIIFVKDENFVIVDANPAFIEMYPENERHNVIGFTTLEKYNAEEAAEFLAMDKKAFAEGESKTTENILFPDGVTRILETHKTLFTDRMGKKYILGTARDVTEREALIKNLTESNQELERFAYVCSHDIQEPLRMVKSFGARLGQVLEPQIKDDEKAQKYLDHVIEGASRAQQLIREILAYSTVSSSTERLVPVDLNKVVGVVIDRLNTESPIDQQLVMADTLPTVSGQETQLFQLLSNLINNALKYQDPDRQPRVRVTAIDVGNQWEVSVADNGIGIEEKYFSRIFEVFRRLHRSDEYPGTGVGLALCRKIVETHGGRIWVTSEPGAGSRFTFTLAKTSETENSNE